MRCFYHAEAEAVGTCKHCHRGLCRACAAERSAGLACRGHCEAAVDAVGRLVSHNIQIVSAPAWPFAVRMAVYWAVTAAMLYLLALQADPVVRVVAGGLAAITFIAGLGSARLLLRHASRKAD
jgi:hypothetical protein